MTPQQFFDFQTYVFDVDSTLCSIEGIDELARLNQVYELVSELTKKSMNGDFSYQAIFEQRLSMIKPHKQDLATIAQLYLKSISKGVSRVIKQLHSLDKEVLIVSGGYKSAILPLAHKLNIDSSKIYANQLKFDHQGSYIHYALDNPLSMDLGKKKVIESLKLNLKQPTLMIGDSVSDAETKNDSVYFCCYTEHITRQKALDLADFVLPSFQPLIGSTKEQNVVRKNLY